MYIYIHIYIYIYIYAPSSLKNAALALYQMKHVKTVVGHVEVKRSYSTLKGSCPHILSMSCAQSLLRCSHVKKELLYIEPVKKRGGGTL